MSPQINKADIMSTVSSLISNSTLNDTEIAEKAGVSRQMIFKWRTGKVRSIRKSNLVSLANALDQEITFEDDKIALMEAEITEGEGMMLSAGEIISDLRSDKTDLRERISVLKEENSALLTTIKGLESRINDLISQNPMPITLSLDHDRMQFIVNTDKLSYINTTQKYADLYGKNAFDVVNDCKWADLVCEEDMWRLPVIHAHSLDSSDNNIKTTWKICKSHSKTKENMYFETTAMVLDEKGIFKKIDVEPSTIIKWKESNEYFKSFPALNE